MPRSLEDTAAVLEKVLAREIKLVRAAEQLGIGPKQVRRLARRYASDGLEGLKSRRRGRLGSGHSDDFRREVLVLVKSKYAGFGPTLASEKLKERDGIHVSREWLRLAMMEAGLWRDRRARQPRIHQLRDPCERRGELVQIDGSHHQWFENRGPKCVLLVFIDDATSEVGHLKFVPCEDSLSYMSATREYVKKHGKPIAFYSDKHSVFYNSKANLSRGDGATQFGAVLQRLGITIICADSSQAKGRVERANRTLQDRLVKEMRLEQISTIDDANKFVPAYLQQHNSKFARLPLNTVDAHRPIEAHDLVDDIVRWEETRKVTKSLSVHYNKVIFILDDTAFARAAVGKLVTVCDFPDGRLEIRHDGLPLPYRRYDKLRRVNQPEVVGSKRLQPALEMAKLLQELQPHHHKRNSSGPSRKSQISHMFPEYGLPPRSEAIGDLRTPQSTGSETRIVSRQLSLQYRNVRFVLEETMRTRDLIGREVTIHEGPDGRVEICSDGVPLAYKTMVRTAKPAAPPAEGSEGRLSAACQAARRPQLHSPPEARFGWVEMAATFPLVGRRPGRPPARVDQQIYSAAVRDVGTVLCETHGGPKGRTEAWQLEEPLPSQILKEPLPRTPQTVSMSRCHPPLQCGAGDVHPSSTGRKSDPQLGNAMEGPVLDDEYNHPHFESAGFCARRRGRRPRDYVGPPTVQVEIDLILERVAKRRSVSESN